MSISWNNIFAERTKNITGSQIRQFFALTEQPEVISFAGGFPGNDFFPKTEIAMALTEMIRKDSRQALQYGPTEGTIDLRTFLAAKMSGDGACCATKNLIITDGSQQGLDLLGRILVDEGDPVLVEEPSYIGAMSAFKSYGGTPVGIAMDEAGPIPADMENTIKILLGEGRKPKMFYTVPNFQNPTGITTSLERRREILAIAARYNLLIIEDDPYGKLCYEGATPPGYFALDRLGLVVFLGSYSKVLIPGIRIGWMAAPQPLIDKVALAKQTTDLCSSSLGQQLAYRLSREGFVESHTRLLTELYRQKRDIMLEGMQKHFPASVRFNRPKGGFFIWVNFPNYFPPSRKLLEMALERKVAFVHGEGFFSNGGGMHSARFSFSQPGIEDIVTGIKRLGELFHEVERSCAPAAVGQ